MGNVRSISVKDVFLLCVSWRLDAGVLTSFSSLDFSKEMSIVRCSCLCTCHCGKQDKCRDFGGHVCAVLWVSLANMQRLYPTAVISDPKFGSSCRGTSGIKLCVKGNRLKVSDGSEVVPAAVQEKVKPGERNSER